MDADARRVLQTINTQQAVNRQTVMQLLGVEKTKALEVLRELTELGLIKREGRGRATRYVLVPAVTVSDN